MKRILLSLLAWYCFVGTQAQETPHRINLNASLSMHGSEPGYILGLSYTRFFGNYIGVTGGLNTQTWYSIDCRPLWEVTGRDGKVYHLDDDDDKYANVNVYVGPSFRLPLLTFGRDEDYTFYGNVRRPSPSHSPTRHSPIHTSHRPMGTRAIMKQGTHTIEAANGTTGN